MMRAKRTVMNAWRTAAMTLVALSALSAASAQNLVQDPSFETTFSNNTYGSPPTTWSFGQRFGGSYYGGGSNEPWLVISGSIDIPRSPGYGGPPGPGNDQFVELNGDNPGAIRQEVTVSQAGLYNFSFYYGGYAAWIDNNGNQQDAAPDYVLSARARIVDNSNNVVLSAIVGWSIAAAGGFNGSWIDTPYTAQIVLSAGTYYVEFETLHFGGVDSNGNTIPNYFGPRIDNVNLSLVPEPASMVALGAGLTGLLGLRRRRARG
jgi:hypothetical protein